MLSWSVTRGLTQHFISVFYLKKKRIEEFVNVTVKELKRLYVTFYITGGYITLPIS